MKKVIVFGAGDYLRRYISIIQRFATIVDICDNDEKKWGMLINGIKCIPPSKLSEQKDLKIIIVAEARKTREEIMEQLLRQGLKGITLWEFLADCIEIDSPVEVFTEERHIYIWGTEDECKFLDWIITNYCRNVIVDGYITQYIKNIKTESNGCKQVISLYRAQKLLREKKIAGILGIADKMGFNVVTRRNVDEDILCGDSYFIVPKKIFLKGHLNEKDIKDIFTLYRNTFRTGTFQFLITQKCNLNCKACSHFAALVKEDAFYDYQQYLLDLKRMSELADDVDEIGLWGGEPLLCADLDQYILAARKAFPSSRVVVGTNGLLILQLDSKIIKAMKETKAIFAISLYPPTLNRIEEIKDFLDKNGIPARYPVTTKIEQFFKRYDLSGKNSIEESYKKCGSKYCTTIYNGKLSACYFPIVAENFNRYFGHGFDVDDEILDIYDMDLDKEKLFAYLRKPMKMCRYCGEMKYEKWEICKKSTIESDWII